MAAVTSDILNNMLRTSLTDLKSFVEVLNAELAEEGQGDENRAAHKDNISHVLRSFGECEALLNKSSKCLHEVEAKMNDHFTGGAWESVESVEEEVLHDEIEQIIKTIRGRGQSDEDDQPLLNLSIDDEKIGQHLESIEGILDEFHPLKFTDDGEDDQQRAQEEEQISQRLEAIQKKAISRLEKRMNDLESQNDDEEYVSSQEESSSLEDDDEFDYDSLERVDDGQAESNSQAKRNMDARLKAMWNEYNQERANVHPIDTNQLFTEVLENQPDENVENLRYFSQFNNNILELFSQEAPLIVRSSRKYVDPISKKKIKHPVRNTICDHIYEKDIIYGVLKKKKKMRCPFFGCSCASFTIKDVVEDDDVAFRINQNSARRRRPVQQDTENMETEDEDDSTDSPDGGNDNDDTQINVDTEDEDTNANIDTENAETQSQELL